MVLKDKYISKTEAGASPPEGLIVLSDDAFAICEFLEQLRFAFIK